jgi:hypothetical protein
VQVDGGHARHLGGAVPAKPAISAITLAQFLRIRGLPLARRAPALASALSIIAMRALERPLVSRSPDTVVRMRSIPARDSPAAIRSRNALEQADPLRR